MTPEEFTKLMQARQDQALAQRDTGSKPSFIAQRVFATKQSQNDARLIISCNKDGYLDLKFAQTAWHEVSTTGNVRELGPNELSISVPGNKLMFSRMETALAKIFAHAATKGVKEFSIRGQWDRFPAKTGMFSREQVLAKDFATFEK